MRSRTMNMKKSLFRFFTVALFTFWSSPISALTTLQIDLNETPAYYCLNEEINSFRHELNYVSDTFSFSRNNPNGVRTFTYNGILVNINDDIVYNAFPVKLRLNRDVVLSNTQNVDMLNQMPEPIIILLFGAGILFVVGIGRKINPKKKKISNEIVKTDDRKKEMNYCEYIIDDELKRIAVSKEETS